MAYDQQLADAEAELKRLRASFELRHRADMRAIKRWQKATGRTKIWPDHADLLVWLMEKNRRLEDALKTICELDASTVDAAPDIAADALQYDQENAHDKD